MSRSREIEEKEFENCLYCQSENIETNNENITICLNCGEVIGV